MHQHIFYIPALILVSFFCSSCRDAIDDVVLESTTTVQKKWTDLVPGAGRTGNYTFVRFDLSAETDLVDVWDGLILQVECGLTGSNADKSLDSVTFGPFYDGKDIGSLRILESEPSDILPNEFGRFEYVVYALPNFEVGKLVNHRRESWSVFDSDFDRLACYFRGVSKPSFGIPKSVVWSVSREELVELSGGI